MLVLKRFIIITPFILLFLGACNITQEYTFNKDFSGTSQLEIDMSAMVGMLGENDSIRNNSLDTITFAFKKMAEEYEKMGAKNVKFGSKGNNTIYYLSFDFQNVEDLNKLLSSRGSEMMGASFMGDSTTEKPKFIKKWNRRLIYDAPEVKNDTLFNNKEMASMKDYYNYTLKFNFATKIRKLKSDKAIMSSDKKSIQFSGSMFDVLSTDYSTDFEVKLKRK